MDTRDQPVPKNEFGVYSLPDGVSDRPAAKAVLSGGVYEPETIAFMRENCKTGDVIHAGTFFGDFIPALSKALAPRAKLWAFEPNPGNFAAAEKTVSMNALGNVELTNAALSDTEGELLFRTRNRKGKPLGGLSRHVDKPGEGVEPVQALMLDFHVPRERDVSILQLDVEGHEKQALRGAFHLIRRCRPILILEYFKHARWLNRVFPALGYKDFGKLHSNRIFMPERQTEQRDEV